MRCLLRDHGVCQVVSPPVQIDREIASAVATFVPPGQQTPSQLLHFKEILSKVQLWVQNGVLQQVQW